MLAAVVDDTYKGINTRITKQRMLKENQIYIFETEGESNILQL